MLPLQLRSFTQRFVLANLSLITLLTANLSVNAQVVSDLSLNTQVNLEATEQIIRGGNRQGTNLFHSFSQFSPTAEFTTRFDNHLDIQTIFSRVTGNIPSLIDGTITTNGTADLFLLNPAGIIIGENAQLNIGGSFIATTAESIVFADGTEFSSQLLDNQPLLTVSIPVGLQYGKEPGNILTNPQGNIPLSLAMPPHATFALLGGKIKLNQTTVNAPSGQVILGSVAGLEEITIKSDRESYNFTYDKVQQFNDLIINPDSSIDTSGGGGRIQIRGNNIFISQSEILNFTKTEQGSGSIFLTADNRINLNRMLLITQVGGQGNPENNPEINPSDSLIRGNAGDIVLLASKVNIDGGTAISASTLGGGKGGNITIDANSLSMSGFSDFGSSLIVSATGSSAAGGTIEINAANIHLADGARIDSSSFGTGKAGTININARELITIDNSNPFNNLLSSGVFAAVGFPGLPFELQLPGRSGNININSPKLLLQNGGQISVSNFGTENAGNMFINVGILQLEDNSQIVAETASGKGGSIFITSEQLILRDNSSISARADRNGNGGNLEIETTNLVLLENSLINANAKLGSGGNVTIYTEGLFTVVDPELVITASSELGVDGVVEIINPNDESKKETVEPLSSLLSAENLFVNYCSNVDDIEGNKFVYIGRGGLDTQSMPEAGNWQFFVDLGSPELIETNITEINHSTPLIKSQNTLKEASSITIDEQGNLELVATNAVNNITPGCIFN